MALMGKILKGSMVITVGEVVTQLCGLARNVILARILTKADFGVAALLAMTFQLMEIGGRLSIEHLIVQSKEGAHPRFVAVAHMVQAVLGLVSGILILMVAIPMADFYKVPGAIWAFQVVAVLPFLKALSHLDVSRMMREMRFGPGVMIEVISQLAITVAAWPLAVTWPSYAVLVWLLLVRQVVSTVASHLIAERPYRWAFDAGIVRSIFIFGWPMLISGLLLFAAMQGDRFAVGIRYSVSELGVYAVAGTLALVPAATLMKLSGSIFLPLLSSTQDNPPMFIKRLAQVSETLALFSALYAVVMILAGGPLVVLIFGAKYHDAAALTGWLGLGQALRLLRTVPTIASMARGDTKNLMFANICRLSGLALAFPVAFAGASLWVIAACAAVGELVALGGSFWRFSKLSQIPVKLHLPSWSLAGVFIGVSAILAWAGLPQLVPWIPLSGASLLIVGLVAAHLSIFKESRLLLVSTFAPLAKRFFRSANVRESNG